LIEAILRVIRPVEAAAACGATRPPR